MNMHDLLYWHVMNLGVLALHVVSTLLLGYLSVSDFLALHIAHGLSSVGYDIAYYTDDASIQKSDSLASVTPLSEPQPISILPSRYEIGGPIPKILIENARYQQAAIGATATTAPEVLSKTASDPRDALVNIFCTFSSNGTLRATTGSGVLIDEKGIILTNAHVAQFLLLDGVDSDINTKCIVRAGSPATPRYMAKLLYISPLWVNSNAKELRSETPTGTGERDYALLYISDSIDTTPLPSTFAFIAPETARLTDRAKETDIRVGGYPAEILKTAPNTPLTAVIATTNILGFYTYGSKEADMMSIAPSSAGEQGTSGGLVINEHGKLIGLVSTRGDTLQDGARSLRAITLPYIDRTIKEETGFGLLSTMSGNPAFKASVFKEALTPFLSALVEAEIKERIE